jgi:hypothetical protein
VPDEDDDNEPEGISLSRDDLRQLREKARVADEAQTKLAELERKVLFGEAGINLSDKAGQYFVKGYEGEMTVDAIKAEAEEMGLFKKVEQQRQQVPQQELAQHQQMSRTAAGGGDPSTEDYAALIASASSAEEVMQIATRFGVPTTYNRSE